MPEWKTGDVVRAFHPSMFGVVLTGRIVKVGPKWFHIDFGSLRGGVFKVAPDYIVDYA